MIDRITPTPRFDQLIVNGSQETCSFFVNSQTISYSLWDIIATRFSFQLAIVLIIFNTFVKMGNLMWLNLKAYIVYMRISGKNRPSKK